MIAIRIAQGDTVRIEVEDGDGSFEIRYSDTELTVAAELPGSHLGNDGLIYRDVFGGCTCQPPSIDLKCPTHGMMSGDIAVACDNLIAADDRL